MSELDLIVYSLALMTVLVVLATELPIFFGSKLRVEGIVDRTIRVLRS